MRLEMTTLSLIERAVNRLNLKMNWYIRPKLAVTEDLPTTKPYAEQLWAEFADARYGPIDPIACSGRARWARLAF
jgi:hypothetical protein